MFAWLRAFVSVPQPSGPSQILKAFTAADPTITGGPLEVEGQGWCAEVSGAQNLRLFEFQPPVLERCMITYRAQIKTEDLRGDAYLELWCRFPGRGEFFSKGLDHAVTGTNDWASYEVPFYLKKGQSPDLLKLNVVCKGAGRLWIKDVEILQTPLG
ncbi:MAG: hypothetical protein QNJ67_21830 [Kiloniellales bacterium]|nr:hypothetical protein [Kiloniellales bacterium]